MATEKKVYIGKANNYFGKIGVGEFYLETGELHVGDKIIIMGPATGVMEMTVGELRVDLKPTDSVKKGDLFSMPTIEKIRRNDKLYVVMPAEKVNDNQN